MNLAQRDCVPCRGGVPPLSGEKQSELHEHLEAGWERVEEHHLAKDYAFSDFVSALAFVNRVGALAEDQAHHPDLHLAWGKVTIEIWTHKINGLTESDFVFAAKADVLFDVR